MTLPYTLESDLMERKTRALQLFDAGYGTDIGTFSRLLALHQLWPDLAPGAKLSFAQAGLSPSDPVVHAAARLNAAQNINRDAWMKALPATGPTQIPDHVQAFIGRLQQAGSLKDFKSVESDPLFKQLPKHIREQVAEQAINGQLSHSTFSAVTSALGYSLGRAAKGDIAGALGGPGSQQATPADQDLKVGGVNVSATGRDIVREAANAGISGLQATQGIIRNEAGGGTPLFSASGQDLSQQTNLGQEVGHGLSSGDGILPDPNSPAALAAAGIARQTAPTIDGHAFTLGRATAYEAGQATNAVFGTHIFQPGSTSFNLLSGLVDAGIAIKGDPTAQILRGIGDAREAGHLFTPEQVVDSNAVTTNTGLAPLSVTPEAIPGTKTAYLNSPGLEGKLNQVAAMKSDSAIIRYMGGPTATPPELAAQLADAPDISSVRQVFQDNTLPYKPTFGGPGYELQKTLDSRLLAQMPNKVLVDINNKGETWTQLERTFQATGMAEPQRNILLDGYLRADTPRSSLQALQDGLAGMIQQYRPNDEALLSQADALRERAAALPLEERAPLLAQARTLSDQGKFNERFAQKVANLWSEDHQMQTAYAVDQSTGLSPWMPGQVRDGQGVVFGQPTADSERLNSLVRLPNARDLRKLTTKYGALLDNPVIRNSSEAIDGIINAWKTTIVARPQLLAKISGETQFNLAMRDYLNIFTHPVKFMNLVAGTNLGSDSRLLKLLTKFSNDPSFINDIKGQPILDDAVNLLQRSFRYGGQDPGAFVTTGFHNASLTDPRAAEGLVETLGRKFSDPIFRGVAQQDGPEAAKEWFYNGEGAAARLARAPITAFDDAHLAQAVAAGKYGPGAEAWYVGDIANSRAAADSYIENAHLNQINDLTGGNQELLDALRTGKLRGQSLMVPVGHDSMANPAAVDVAQEIIDARQGPRAWVTVRDAHQIHGSEPGVFNKVMDGFFHYMLDVPDKVLNRVPAYVQAYWKRAIDQAPYADEETLRTMAKSASEANLPDELMSRFRNIKLDASDTPRLSLNQIHDGAKAMALTDLGKVAHDLTTRTNLFDRLRWFVPFGDAWRLVMKRGAQLIADEPQVLQRLNVGLYEAKQPGSDTLNTALGNPVPPGQPFFHKDPQTGELSVSVPGSGLLTQATFGVPIPLDSTVKGLTMASDAMPGIGGPLLTLPAKWLLPDTPTGNAIKDVIFPFGGGDSQGIGTDVANQFEPSWFQKLTHQYPNKQAYASLFNAALQSLASTKNYNLNKPSELSRLASDAKDEAKWMYTVRGIAQFLVPGAPIEQNLVKGTNDKWVDAYVAGKAYKAKQTKLGNDGATAWLINNFGVNNIFLSQPASQPVGYASPTTKKGEEFVLAHPDLRSKYPLTFGLVVPAMPGDKFDLSVYSRESSRGSRTPLTEAQQIAQGENRLGFYAYNRAVSEVAKANGGIAPDKRQREELAAYRNKLKVDLPGFDTYTASPYDTVKRRTQAITELAAMVKDKDVLSTDAGQGLLLYFQARHDAIVTAQEGGLKSPFAAKAAQPIRDQLRNEIVPQILKQHPEFAPMWNDVFSREMVSN